MSHLFSSFAILRKLGTVAFLLFLPGVAYADEAEPIPTEEDQCQVEIKLISPEPETEYELLLPIEYRFIETHDDKCQQTIRIRQDKAFVCRQTDSHLTLLNGPAGEGRVQNEITVTCRYRLAGYYFTSPIAIDFQLNDAPVITHVLPNTAVHIVIPAMHPEDEALLHTLLPWHRRIPALIFWILVGIVVMLLALYITESRRREALRRAQLEMKPKVKLPTPIEIFQSKLSPLLEESPEQEADIKLFYDKLSEALKFYLSQRLLLPVMESTTRQQAKLLHGVLADGHIDEIIRVLSDCDLVKFSRVDPSPTKRMALVRDTGILVSSIERYISQKESQEDTNAVQPNETSEATLAAKSLLVSVDFDPAAAHEAKQNKTFTPRSIWTASPDPIEQHYDSETNDLEGLRLTNPGSTPVHFTPAPPQTPEKKLSHPSCNLAPLPPGFSSYDSDTVEAPESAGKLSHEEELLEDDLGKAFSNLTKPSVSEDRFILPPLAPVKPSSSKPVVRSISNPHMSMIPQLLSALRPHSSRLTPVESQKSVPSAEQSFQDILSIFSEEEVRQTHLDEQRQMSPISVEGMETQELWLTHSHSYSSDAMERAQHSEEVFDHALDQEIISPVRLTHDSLRHALEKRQSYSNAKAAQQASKQQPTPDTLNIASITKENVHQRTATYAKSYRSSSSHEQNPYESH